MRSLHSLVTIHGLHIHKIDAMSLSAMEIDQQGLIGGHIPRLDGLTQLSRELADILNKGWIRQQSFLAISNEELAECSKACDALHLPQSNRKSLPDEVELLSFDSSPSAPADGASSLQLIELKTCLRDLYISLNAFSQCKLTMLRCTREVAACYESSLIEIATSHGVLQAERKFHTAASSVLQGLVEHKLFSTEEEHGLLRMVRELWGRAALGGSASQELADLDLARATKSPRTSKYLALQMGAAVVLLIWTVSECFNNERSADKVWHDPTFAIFMCIGDFLLLQFMWGVSMTVWRRAGVDFVQLLQLQQTEVGRARYPEQMVFQSATRYSLIFLSVFICFNKAVHLSLKGGHSLAYVHCIPVLLAVYFIHAAIWPWDSRRTWLGMIGKVIAAPCYPVIFRDGYIGDILTSLVRVLVPLSFSLIYVLISVYAWLANDLQWTISMSDRWWSHNSFTRMLLIPFLTLYPLVIRLLQCLRRSVETGQRWPHLANALKYSSAIVVIAFASFQPALRREAVWVASLVGATLFQYCWDLTQDWGMVVITVPSDQRSLLDTVTDISLSLRSKRLLGPAWSYVLVMTCNLALRFAWTLTLLPAPDEDDRSMYATVLSHITPIVAAAEIVRRMVWGFYRLEFEQIEILQRQPPTSILESRDLEKVSLLLR